MTITSPPGLHRRLLRLLLPGNLRRDVLAELDARHARLALAHGRRDADRWYRDQARRSILPALFERRRRASANHLLPARFAMSPSSLFQDLRFSLRWMGTHPGFTAVLVATLALGIGANVAMFSVVRGVLLRPLPYDGADRIARIYNSDPAGGGRSSTAWLEAVEYREAVEALPGVEALVPFDVYDVTLTGIENPRQVRATFVGPGFFEMFGTEPERGRALLGEEQRPGADGAVVIAHGLWRDLFGGADDVLGRELLIDGRPRRVVGVMPADFAFYPDTRLWLPLALDEAALTADDILSHGAPPPLIRLAPGVDFASVQGDVDAAIARVLERYPEHDAAHVAEMVPLQDWLTGGVRPALMALMSAVGGLLLVSCTNVANLLLARAESRRREFSIRRALGAGTDRLAAQLLVESTALALGAAAVAIGAAWWARGALVGLAGDTLPRTDSIAIDGQVLAFTLAITLATALLFGLAPLLGLRRRDAADALREGRGSVGGGLRFRQALIVAEVVLVVALLMGAGLMARSFLALSGVDPGVDTRSTLTFRLSLPEAAYPGATDVQGFFTRLHDRLGALPDVEAVGAVSWLPYADQWSNWGIELEGAELPGDIEIPHYALTIGDYFDAIGIPVLRGTALRPEDQDTGVVITRTTESLYFSSATPLGRRLRFRGESEWRSVVGVVDDYYNQGYDRAPDPGVYLLHEQLNFAGPWFPRRMAVVLRTRAAPAALAAPVRDIVRSLDADLPVERLATMGELIEGTMLARPRMTAWLFALFAALALALGCAGIHGVVSWAVHRETREIGVRLALGARGRTVLLHVARRALAPVAIGLVVGLLASAWLGRRLLASMLVDVGPVDPLTTALVVFVLGLASVLSVVVPARRALRIDPVDALRDA